jgi:phosphoglycolate phosphatase-like HAD superfamily hydrolase
MAKVGATPEETVLVGDSRVDVATAPAAGISVVAVTWGLGARDELVEAGATALVDAPSELGQYLR